MRLRTTAQPILAETVSPSRLPREPLRLAYTTRHFSAALLPREYARRKSLLRRSDSVKSNSIPFLKAPKPHKGRS